ncbi:MAG: SDR family NAD(P)-dependent oxidoreductase, partial [Desulfosalsimonas sp.]
TWQALIDVHLNGAYHVTRPAFRVMREKGYGRIIMTTSAAGLYGNFGQTNYSAAKMGLVGFMNTVGLEGKKHNIKVNTVAPLAASRLTEDVLPADLLDKLKPEFVSPLVMYLCSDRCRVTGHIYNAAMGCFNRAAVATGPGAVVGDPDTIPTAEQVRDELAKIRSLKDARYYEELNQQVADVLNAFEKAPGEDAGGGDSKRFTEPAQVFSAMPEAFNPDAARQVDAVFQYHISGQTGGDWFCVVSGQTCSVEEGTHEKPTCIIKMEDRDFLAMINGELPAMQAYTSGRLKIGGDVMKSQLIEKLFVL